MNPAKLERFCSYEIVNLILKSTRDKCIRLPEHQDYLIELLVVLLTDYDMLSRNGHVQTCLYQELMMNIRYVRDSEVVARYMTLLILLSPSVVADQISEFESLSSPITVEVTIVSEEDSNRMMNIISQVIDKVGDILKQDYMLTTSKLLLEGIGFEDNTFLPWLITKMPRLEQLSLQFNWTVPILNSISSNCKKLEAMTFVEGSFVTDLKENDIVDFLFGANITTTDAIQHLKHQEKPDLVCNFPKLKVFDIDEIYLSQSAVYNVYLLLLLVQPQMESLGRHSGFYNHIFSLYEELSQVGKDEKYPCMACSKISFCDSLQPDDISAQQEIDYIESVIYLFRRTKSIGIMKLFWSKSNIIRFISLFQNQIEALSLSSIPYHELKYFSFLSHLRLLHTCRCSFQTIHHILDNCPKLKTLSIHRILETDNSNIYDVEDSNSSYFTYPELSREERRYFEGLMPAAFRGLNANEIDNPELVFPAASNYTPPVLVKPKLCKHTTLTSLKITSKLNLLETACENELRALLQRIPYLTQLCCGLWLGCLIADNSTDYLSHCTTSCLYKILSTSTEVLLPDLKQICCMPIRNSEDSIDVLWNLSLLLPALHTIVQPVLDKKLIRKTIRKFANTHIQVQHKCDIDSVFPTWDPSH